MGGDLSSGPPSWGRHPAPHDQQVVPLISRSEPLPRISRSLLPRGLGRSYGDSCLNDGGALLLARGLDRFIRFDAGTGLLACEAGVSLAEIVDFALPRGWFLPVSPGTRHVTLGGAIANDVHGKNHHRAGSFGNHVVRLELLRSDGSRTTCSRDENAGLFRATIGGLGLTGLVTWAELRLHVVAGPWMEVDTRPFRGLAELVELSEGLGSRAEYCVGWLDATARGGQAGRGIFMAGDHSAESARRPRKPGAHPAIVSVPADLPFSWLHPAAVRAFNAAYAWRGRTRAGRARVGVDAFFHPLDVVGCWNRLYGPSGFVQHQCVVPRTAEGRRALETILALAEARKRPSYLSVVKVFGDLPGEGLLSFARPGITLALDFPVTPDGGLFPMLDEIDDIVVAAGGALYPAKDARMSAATFRASFPRLPEFLGFVDPAFSSSFWRRVGGSR